MFKQLLTQIVGCVKFNPSVTFFRVTFFRNLVFHIFAALAEFERNLIQERTRARGRKGGRPKALNDDKRKLVIELYKKRDLPVSKIREIMRISMPTLNAYVRNS